MTSGPQTQPSKEELMEAAIEALDLRFYASRPLAEKYTSAIADRFAKLTAPGGPYDKGMKFSDIRKGLEKEGNSARKLAAQLPTLQDAMPYVLGDMFGKNEQTVKNAHQIHKIRSELAHKLNVYARIIDVLGPHWRKGGAWNVTKAELGPPNRWLAEKCLEAFETIGNLDGVVPSTASDGSPILNYANAVYEMATKSNPDGMKAGLWKEVDKVASRFQKSERKREHDRIKSLFDDL